MQGFVPFRDPASGAGPGQAPQPSLSQRMPSIVLHTPAIPVPPPILPSFPHSPFPNRQPPHDNPLQPVAQSHTKNTREPNPHGRTVIQMPIFPQSTYFLLTHHHPPIPQCKTTAGPTTTGYLNPHRAKQSCPSTPANTHTPHRLSGDSVSRKEPSISPDRPQRRIRFLKQARN